MIVLLPDGVEREIPLEHMVIKDAIFVPTLTIGETKMLLQRLARMVEIKIETTTTIESGYLGVMIWRTA